jgi:hypothetical protein
MLGLTAQPNRLGIRRRPVLVANIAPVVSTANDSTYTFNDVDISTLAPAAPNRSIVIFGAGRATGAARTLSGITVDGNAAAPLVALPGSQNSVGGLFAKAYPTGNPDIVATFSGDMSNGGIKVFVFYGLISPEAAFASATSDDDNEAVAVNIPYGGLALFATHGIATGEVTSATGYSSDFNTPIESGNNSHFAGGHYINSTNALISGHSMSADWTGAPATGNVCSLGVSLR